MIDLAEGFNLVAVFHKGLTHADRIRINGDIAKIGLQVIETHRLRSDAQHQRVA